MQHHRLWFGVSITVVLLLATGCSHPVPRYTETVENVDRLLAGGNSPVNIGVIGGSESFKSEKLRADSAISPYGESFADYLQAALKAEFTRAGRLKPDAKVEVAGMLLKNTISVGVETAHSEISARITVRAGTQLRYDKTHSARDDWPSHFMAALAIPTARSRYPIVVNKLIGTIFADPEFIAAIR
jgi:hypothetical protein